MIDWHQLINNFQNSGVGVNELATMSGCLAQDICYIVQDIYNEPPFSTGIKLLDIHSDYFPHKHKSLWEE